MATLWKHPNGTYYVRWQEEGKNRRKSLQTKEKRIAKRRYNNFNRELLAGKIIPISEGIKKSFFTFCDEFLRHIEATTGAETYRLYSDALKKAKSCWGDIPLNHITERHIDSLIADMTRSGLKIPTVNKNYRHVKAALKKAQEWQYIKNPIKFPKQIKEKKQVRYLPIKDLRKIISIIDDLEFLDFCMFSGYTGLRSGEIIRLQWRDIDNPEGFIRIVPEQKNKEDSRIPINSNARAILERCKARGHKKIFRFITRTWISQKFKKYIRDAGFENYRFHDLRHTFASHLAMKGKSLQAIQELMRHKSYESTKIYAQLSPDYLKEVSESLDYGPMPIGNFTKKQ